MGARLLSAELHGAGNEWRTLRRRAGRAGSNWHEVSRPLLDVLTRHGRREIPLTTRAA